MLKMRVENGMFYDLQSLSNQIKIKKARIEIQPVLKSNIL